MDWDNLILPVIAINMACVYLVYPILLWLGGRHRRRLEFDISLLRLEVRRMAGKVPQAVQATQETFDDTPRDSSEAGIWGGSFDCGAWYASHSAQMKAEAEPEQPTIPGADFERADTSPSPVQRKGFEQQLGGRLAVWAGGLALALAGFFLVQYSIRVGLLTPVVRDLLGTAFGLALLQGGRVVGESRLTDNVRIAQALVGAGIASLYASAYTASTVYALIPSFEGFFAMAAITAVAVTMSLRHGAPIAVLGMLGGYLTPALISSPDPSAAALFTYLLLLTAGLNAVLARKGWWRIAAVATVCALLWAAGWIGHMHADTNDGIWLNLYLAGICASLAWHGGRTPILAAPRDGFAERWLATGGVIVATMLSAWIVDAERYDLVATALFWAVSACGIALAAQDSRRYQLVPFVSAVLAAWLVAVWGPWTFYDAAQSAGTSPSLVVSVTLAFAMLHVASGHTLIWRRVSQPARPVVWGALAAFSAIAYFIAAWIRLHNVTHDIGFPVLGTVALVLSLGAIEATRQIAAHFDATHPDRPRLLAIGAGAAASFLSLGLAIELDRDFLPIAIAGEVLALAWISSLIRWPSLRWYAAALAGVYVCLLLPQFLLLVEIVLFSLTESAVEFGTHIAFAERPLFQLALPALMLAVASVWLRRDRDDWIVRGLEILTVALSGLSAYYLTRHLFHAQVLFTPATFVERGVNTNVLFLAGLGCLWLGRSYRRIVVSRMGLLLAGIALFRIVWFDLLVKNPLFFSQSVGDLTLLNALILPYALPILWIAILRRELAAMGITRFGGALKIMALVLGFTFVSLEVRQLFHGTYLYDHTAGNFEVYAYSLAWLLLGLALLFAGTLRRDRMLRIASLAVMLLTVCKVFLYDAAQLDGLWRVFSFLGLGLSLLGLSWFYSRFVFERDRPSQEEATGP